MKKETTQIKAALRRVKTAMQGAELISTPLGPLYAAASRRGLFMLRFVDEAGAGALPVQKGSAVIGKLRKELDIYFRGKLKDFSVPVKFEYGTEFQQQVWKALGKIPFGKICSYQDVAKHCGTPEGYRAVGMANGANPVVIVIPCHRVINASGQIGGYGSGITRKIKLLELEGVRFSTRGQLI